MEGENQYSDSGNYYSQKEPVTIREIVLRAIDKCRLEMSKEMTKGGEIKKEIGGHPITITLPDQRKVVEEVINAFYDLCVPHFDDGEEEIFKQLQNKKVESYKIVYEEYLKEEFDEDLKRFAERSKLIPHPGSSFYAEKAHGLLDEYLHQIDHLIFQELLIIFKKHHFLSSL